MRDTKANARAYYRRHKARLSEYYAMRYYMRQFEKMAAEMADEIANYNEMPVGSTDGVAGVLTGVEGTTGVADTGVGATWTTACGLES